MRFVLATTLSVLTALSLISSARAADQQRPRAVKTLTGYSAQSCTHQMDGIGYACQVAMQTKFTDGADSVAFFNKTAPNQASVSFFGPAGITSDNEHHLGMFVAMVSVTTLDNGTAHSQRYDVDPGAGICMLNLTQQVFHCVAKTKQGQLFKADFIGTKAPPSVTVASR